MNAQIGDIKGSVAAQVDYDLQVHCGIEMDDVENAKEKGDGEPAVRW